MQTERKMALVKIIRVRIQRSSPERMKSIEHPLLIQNCIMLSIT